jgi:anion-transporting  ArsA/GET3 family ATPase
VLDTPPSRHAIDFLEAPDRLTAFLEGRALAALLRPSGHAMRAAGIVFAALRRITGIELLDDLTTLFGLLSALLDGFRQRAADVHALLGDPDTGFLIVTSPERSAIDEAAFFTAELDHAGLHRSGVIVNRVHPLDRAPHDAVTVSARLRDQFGPRLADKVARTHVEVQRLAGRDAGAVERLRRALRDDPICVPDRDADVHDIGSLVELHDSLFAA